MRVKEGRRRASSFLLFVVLVATCVISSLVIITVSSRTSSDQVVSSSAAPPSALTTLVETIDRALPQGTPEEQPKGERGRPESPPRVAMLLPIIDKSLKGARALNVLRQSYLTWPWRMLHAYRLLSLLAADHSRQSSSFGAQLRHRLVHHP